MIVDERQHSDAGCDSYGPGHLLHWTLWKKAASAPCVPVSRVVQEGTSIELVISDRESLHWSHHDPSKLAEALEATTSPIIASPQWRALRIGGYWFNCAPEGADVTLCG